MEQREIGKSGIRASVVGLGCNNFGFFNDQAQADRCIAAALDAGITLFDLASEHGAGREEVLVGNAIGKRRNEVVIATKFGAPELLDVDAGGTFRFADDALRQGASRRWIMQSVEESLKRLKTDYIDLYQMHVIDPAVDAEETLGALDDLVRQGKVRAIGLAATHGTADDLHRLQGVAAAQGGTPFSAMQVHYNLLNRAAEADIMPEAERQGISLIPFWPLANGLLTGKYGRAGQASASSRLEKLPMVREWYGDDDWDCVERVRDFAALSGLSMVEIAFAWLLSSPSVASVIAGASTPDQVTQNAQAAGTQLSQDQRDALDQLLGAAAMTMTNRHDRRK